MASGKAIITMVLLGTGCLAETSDEQSHEASIALDDEDDDIQIVYDEASASIGIEVAQFARQVEGSTIEAQVQVTIPDGTMTRHDLDWTPGDDLAMPGIEIPADSNGLYEVVLTRLTIDGEPIDGLAVHGSMWLFGASSGDREAGGQGEKCDEGVTIFGSSGSDELFGTEDNDEIYGEGGADTLHGRECNDILRGGKGNDTLRGGKGKDELRGGKGNDRCYGGKGKDTFHNCEKVFQD